MSKSDGTKIVIQFDDSILSGIEGSESSFEVLVPEYDFVPGGTLVEKNKKVESVDVHTLSRTEITNEQGLVEFDPGIPVTDGYIMVSHPGYLRQTIYVDDLNKDVSIVLEGVGSLPIIDGLICHLDASNKESVKCYDTPIHNVDGLRLWLNAEEVTKDV